ncbi:hypothetical protein GCM10027034_13110 [Ramlibacter solisilvae]
MLLLAGGAQAQSSCSSDGQSAPTALLERFINADCESCWAERTTPEPASGAIAVDWIAPGTRGDDAPLAAAATTDARERLQAAGKALPAQSVTAFSRLTQGRRLRVAHGLPFRDYIGTSIELSSSAGGPWKGWLLLVETLPAGTEGSAVERNLVRNALQLEWKSGPAAQRLREARPMRIPDGAQPDRLRVIGWVEDEQGRLRGIAQSRCAPSREKG